MRRSSTWIGLFVLSLFACSKGDDFLHYVLPEPPPEFHFTHKLKEMVGESRVDILWVIDNSGSMGSHQQNVITNSDLFIREFVKKQKILDWKMGLVSTDESEAPYLGFKAGDELNKSTPDPVNVFNRAVNKLGTFGSGIEKPFFCARKALQDNPNWVRKNAVLANIMVTDAAEQSFISGQDFANFMAQMKGGDLRKVVFYGVLGPNDWNCPATDGFWNYAGSPYEAFAKLVGRGKNYPLCSPDFGKNLAELGKDLVKLASSPRIELTSRPRLETLRVTWRGNVLPGGPKETGGFWTYDFDLNAVLFHDLDFAPDDNEEVIIHYEEAKSGNDR